MPGGGNGTDADDETRTLREELLALFARGVDTALPDAEFDELARRVFAYQFARNDAYAAYCRRRGRTPDGVGGWREIPAVPTAAYKEVALASGDPATAEAVFRTSGTTRGPERRGTHHVLDLSIYHAALLPNFAAHLLPDGRTLPMFSLVPPASEQPDSSLAHMISVVMDRLGAPESTHVAGVERGHDTELLERRLRAAERADTPVCLLGTALAFAHWLDELRESGTRYRLPAGSRLMDTGGFKGERREVPPDELRAGYADRLGIAADYCVNEYGMTELASQFYEPVLRDRGGGVSGDAGQRHKTVPPWVRTLVVDPDTLTPLEPGRTGLLRHYDLANLGSVVAVQTEDVGRKTADGLVVRGRAEGAPPRGCSVAADLLLR